MNPKIYEYNAIIQKVPDIDGTFVPFPYNIKEEFGKGRVKVHATFEGEPYDGSIVNMGIKNDDGSICYIIDFEKTFAPKSESRQAIRYTLPLWKGSKHKD